MDDEILVIGATGWVGICKAPVRPGPQQAGPERAVTVVGLSVLTPATTESRSCSPELAEIAECLEVPGVQSSGGE